MKTNMPAEEFRRLGHEVVDWIAGYLERIRDYPVVSRLQPGELAARLPQAAPECGEPMESVLKDFQSLILPAVTHWNHPRFHAYFSVSASAPGILAETLIAALNMNGMLWKTSPAATELEQVTLAWLRQWIGLPENFFGVVHDTASINALHAIAAARFRADPGVRHHGHAQPLVLYTSEHAHSSIEKGAMVLGIGLDNVRKIGVDAEFRMRPDLLEQAIRHDLAAGRKPFCVCATVGTTSVTSIDPVPDIAAVAEHFGLWLHVDGAYGGAAAVAPEFRHVLAGAERADSLVVNPHKWLFTPIDVSVLYTRHPDLLRRTFSLVPEYLRTSEDARVINFMDYGVPLGRRFRALKLWFIMRYFGREAVAEIIRSHIRWARDFAAWVAADSRFELMAPAPLSVVCFRYKGSNERNQSLLDAVNASGKAYLSHNMMNGRFVIRFAVGNIATTEEDVRHAWEVVREQAERLV
jgi:aromatic-L-amino-acid decarboxylase